jgi:cytochrome P450
MFPPGPRGLAPITLPLAANRDLPGTLRSISRRYGDVAGFRVGPLRAALFTHPDAVRDVLVGRHREAVRGDAMRYMRTVVGNGLLTSAGPTHLKRRRLLQPVFHNQRIPLYGELAVETADRVTATWRDGAVVDVAEEMNRLSLLVSGRAMLNVDLEGEAHRIGAALPPVLAIAARAFNPVGPLLDRLPVAGTRRFRAARAELDRLLLGIIDRRIADGGDHGDLLSLVLAARDAEDGSGLTAREAHEEILTLLLAGHETVASALAWTAHLVATNPDAEARLHEEVDAVLSGRLPERADLPKLAYTEAVVRESMRLMPPVPALTRQTLADYRIGEYTLPKDTTIVLSPAVTHYDPRFFPEPERFAPERWTPEFRSALPRHAYFPFAAGPHQCIGESMAWTECVLAVATIATRWRLRPQPGRTVAATAKITLQPRDGLWMRLERRV